MADRKENKCIMHWHINGQLIRLVLHTSFSDCAPLCPGLARQLHLAQKRPRLARFRIHGQAPRDVMIKAVLTRQPG